MASGKQRIFNRTHDILLAYSKSKEWTFNVDAVRLPYSESSQKRAGYAKSSLGGAAPKSGVCELNKKGRFPEDWWDIPIIRPNAKERLGYPTQKPIALLDRIIKASSNEGDVVFDPFCGCGTAIYTAHLNNRRWIGCDIAILSIQLVRDILDKRYGLKDSIDYVTEGVPLSVEGARVLFEEEDPHQFQNWAIELTGGFCSQKKSGDQGIDGRIHFEEGGKYKNMVLSVKGGHLQPAYLRELRGVLEREDSVMAGFICLENPTQGMIREAASAGQYEYEGRNYNRMQIRTIEQLLQGIGFDTPTRVQTLNWDRQLHLFPR